MTVEVGTAISVAVQVLLYFAVFAFGYWRGHHERKLQFSYRCPAHGVVFRSNEPTIVARFAADHESRQHT